MSSNEQPSAERRKSLRIDMEKEIIDLEWSDEQDNVWHRKIACLDVSKGGLKIDADHPIAANTVVKITFQAKHPKAQPKIGKVLRCMKNESGWYHIAIQFESN